VLHYEVRRLGLGVDPRVEHLDDVLRFDHAARTSFAPEAFEDVAAPREHLLDDHLERDAPTRAEMASLVDRAHTALTEAPHDLILRVYDGALHGRAPRSIPADATRRDTHTVRA